MRANIFWTTDSAGLDRLSKQLREGTGSERGGIRDLGTCLPKGSGTCALPLELL
jgi:hypothetical protein